MSEFNVFLYKVEEILPHTNADKLEIIPVKGYQCVSGKGNFKVGDLAFYLPEQSIVPDKIIVDLNLQGMLSGSQKNRIKAIKLRGELSQGLLYPLDKAIEAGYFEPGTVFSVSEIESVNYALQLQIIKHEPNVPAAFSGVMGSGGLANYLVNYDFDNIKDHPKWFNEDTNVVFTEKLHGTLCQVVIDVQTGDYVISSKGLAKKKICLKNTEENKDNLYISMVKKLGIVDRVVGNPIFSEVSKLAIIGEIFGNGIQDLNYGVMQPEFRVFDIAVWDGEFTSSRKDIYEGWCYLPDEAHLSSELEWSIEEVALVLQLDLVPILYSGTFSKEVLKKYTEGKSIISPNQIKEGIVIKGYSERPSSKRQSRFIVKSINPEYLLRNNGTEYN